MYGVWFKAENKSLLWYDVGAFERIGIPPPDGLTGLLAAERTLAASGVAPLSVGATDQWTLTDWLENLSTCNWPGPTITTDWRRMSSPGPTRPSRRRCG